MQLFFPFFDDKNMSECHSCKLSLPSQSQWIAFRRLAHALKGLYHIRMSTSSRKSFLFSKKQSACHT